MFRIYPAVDIKGGRTVRLYKGDLGKETVYSAKPCEAARAWQDMGASSLHVVDLDGAAKGELVNLPHIREIVMRVKIPLQCGGGVRSREDIERLLSLGVERVILGTRALQEPEFGEEMLRLYGESVIISVDTRGDTVATGAWRETSGRSLGDVLEQLEAWGARSIIHTDIARDGTLEGYDLGGLEDFLDRGMGIIAAGGISDLSDVRKLKGLMHRGIEGAIVGRSIYTGDLDLAAALLLEEG